MVLTGKTAMITGCNRGIGKEVLKLFAAEGADIIAHSRTVTAEWEEELNQLQQKHSIHIRPVYFDMTDTESMKNAIQRLRKEKVNIDILINNAGIAHGGMFQMTPVKDIKNIFDINLFSVMELTQLVSRMMVNNKSGSIVNMASISGLELAMGNCAYGVSKAALIAFTKTLSAEIAPLGVRVNALAPGLTDTNMAKLMEEKAGQAMIRNTALNRLAKPEEIAQAVLFLAGDQSSFITGEVLRVDGGM